MINNKDYTFYSIKSCTDPANSEADYTPAIGALLNEDVFVGGFFDIRIDFRSGEVLISTDVEDALERKDYVANISNLKINGEDASTMSNNELIAALKCFAMPATGVSRFERSPIKDIASGGGIRLSYDRDHGVYTIHSSDHGKIKDLENVTGTFMIKDIKPWGERKTDAGDPIWQKEQEGHPDWADEGESSGLKGQFDAVNDILYLGIDRDSVGVNMEEIVANLDAGPPAVTHKYIHQGVQENISNDEDDGDLGPVVLWSATEGTEVTSAKTVLSGGSIEFYYTPEVALHVSSLLDSQKLQFKSGNFNICTINGSSLTFSKRIDDTTTVEKSINFGALVDSSVLTFGDLSDENFSTTSSKVVLNMYSDLDTLGTGDRYYTVSSGLVADIWTYVQGIQSTNVYGVLYDTLALMVSGVPSGDQSHNYLYLVKNADGITYDEWIWKFSSSTWQAADFIKVGNLATDLSNYYTKSETTGISNLANYYTKTQTDTKLAAYKVKEIKAGDNITLTESPTGTFTIKGKQPVTIVDVVNVVTSSALPSASGFDYGVKFCVTNVNEHRLSGDYRGGNNNDVWAHMGDPYYESFLTKQWATNWGDTNIHSQRWSLFFPYNPADAKVAFASYKIKRIWYTGPCNASSGYNTYAGHPKGDRFTNTIVFKFFSDTASLFGSYRDAHGGPSTTYTMGFNQGYYDDGTPMPPKTYTGGSAGIKLRARKFRNLQNLGWQWWSTSYRAMDSLYWCEPFGDEYTQLNTFPANNNSWNNFKAIFDKEFNSDEVFFTRCDEDAESGTYNKNIWIHKTMNSGWDDSYIIELENGLFYRYIDNRGGGARWADKEGQDAYYFRSSTLVPDKFYWVVDDVTPGTKKWEEYEYSATSSSHPIQVGQVVLGVPYDKQGIIWMTYKTLSDSAFGWDVSSSELTANIKELIAGTNTDINETPIGSGKWTINCTGGSGGGQVYTDGTLLGDGLQTNPLTVTNPFDPTAYYTKTATDSTFLTISDAASTYLTIATAASTYLTTALAASTYAPISTYKVKEVIAGSNISVTEGTGVDAGKWTISNTYEVTSDTTLTGVGTTASPLKVASPFDASLYYLATETFKAYSSATYGRENVGKSLAINRAGIATVYGGGTLTGYPLIMYPTNDQGQQISGNIFEISTSGSGTDTTANLKIVTGTSSSIANAFYINGTGFHVSSGSGEGPLYVSTTGVFASSNGVVTRYNYNTDDFMASAANKFSINTANWKLKDLVAGTNISLTYDSANSRYSIASTAGVTKIVAGTNITIDPVSGLGEVTINSTGGGGGSTGTWMDIQDYTLSSGSGSTAVYRSVKAMDNYPGTDNSDYNINFIAYAEGGNKWISNASIGFEYVTLTNGDLRYFAKASFGSNSFQESGSSSINRQLHGIPLKTIAERISLNVAKNSVISIDDLDPSQFSLDTTSYKVKYIGGTSSGVTKIIAGTNITINSTNADGTGDVTISADNSSGGGGITAVDHDATLTGLGTAASTLSVTNPFTPNNYYTKTDADAAFLTQTTANALYLGIGALTGYYTSTQADTAISTAVTTAIAPYKVKEIVAGTNISVTEGTGANVGKWTIANTQAATTFANIGGVYSDNTSLSTLVGEFTNVAGTPADISTALNNRYHNVAFTADANYKAIGFTTTKGSTTTNYTVSGNDFYMDLTATNKQTIKDYVDSKAAEINIVQGWGSINNIFNLATEGKFRIVHNFPDDSKLNAMIWIDSRKGGNNSYFEKRNVAGIGDNVHTLNFTYYTVFYWNTSTSKWTWIPTYATDKLYEDERCKVWEDSDETIYYEIKNLQYSSLYVYTSGPELDDDEIWIEHYTPATATINLEDSIEFVYNSAIAATDDVLYRGTNEYIYYEYMANLDLTWNRLYSTPGSPVFYKTYLNAPNLNSYGYFQIETPSDVTYTQQDDSSFKYLAYYCSWYDSSGNYQGNSNNIGAVFEVNDKEMCFQSLSGPMHTQVSGGGDWYANKISLAVPGAVVTKMQFDPGEFDLTGDKILVGDVVWDAIASVEDTKANKCEVPVIINEEDLDFPVYPDTETTSQTSNGESIYINFSDASIKGGYSGSTSSFANWVGAWNNETKGWGEGEPFGPAEMTYRYFKVYRGTYVSNPLYLYIALAWAGGTNYSFEVGIGQPEGLGYTDVGINFVTAKRLFYFSRINSTYYGGFYGAFSNVNLGPFTISFYQRQGTTLAPWNPTTLAAQWIPVTAWTLEIKPTDPTSGVMNAYGDRLNSSWNPFEDEHTAFRKLFNSMLIPLKDGTSEGAIKHGPSSTAGGLLDLIDFTGSQPAAIIGNFKPSDFSIDSTTGKIKLAPGHSLSEDKVREMIKEELIKLLNDKNFKKSIK